MSFLEIAGFLFGVAGVWLTIKQHWACFPVGLVNVSISLFLFWQQKLYSDTLQQGVYIVLLVYGWYKWRSLIEKTESRPGLMSSNMKMYLFPAVVMLAFAMGFIFDTYTDADVPYLDATATSMSFAAQFLIARKKIENWIIWMVVNMLYIGIYSYKGLYLYTALFFIYLILAVIGYRDWKLAMRVSAKPGLHE